MASSHAPPPQPGDAAACRGGRSVPRRRAWIAALAVACVAAASLGAWIAFAPLGRAPSAPWPALRIGVEPDAMPLASDTRNYTEEGHEVALARALGRRLGVEPQFVPLAAEAFAAALAAGRVDAVLTRRAPTPRDVEHGTDVTRTGYRSGTSAAMRSDTAVRGWSDLRGRTVCVSRAHARAQQLARDAGARLRVLESPAQALVQVRTGGCDASLHDEAQLAALFARKEWHKFSATLPAAEAGELLLLSSRAHPRAARDLRAALTGEGHRQAWQARNAAWAANVAFEVYFDQIGPDCH